MSISAILIIALRPAAPVYLHCPNHSNAGYCFIEFATPEAAQKALNLNGTPVPNSNRAFKLNWASGGGLIDRRCVQICLSSNEHVTDSNIAMTVAPSIASSSAIWVPRSTSLSSFRFSSLASRPASQLRS